MFNKILVCLDGSKMAEQILPYVEEQALLCNSDVELFQVVAVSGQESLDHRETFFTRLQVAESAAQTYLKGVAEVLKKKSLRVHCATINISPVGYAIVNYAHDNDFDLIAIATRGHGGLGRLLLGSVADYVLQNSTLPILIIRPE